MNAFRSDLLRSVDAPDAADLPQLGFEALADALPQIVWTARPDGWVNYFNKRWFDYAGLTIAQSEGWGWKPVVHPEDREECVQLWKEAVESGQPFEFECRLKRASDQSYRYHLTRAHPVRASDGSLRQWVGVSTDIEEQRRAHAGLRLQAAALREKAALLDLAYDAILVRDLRGIVTFWNRGAEQMYGFSKEQAVGKSTSALLKTKLPQPYRVIEAELKRTGRWQGSLIHRRKDGECVIVESRWALQYSSSGEPSGILEINSDVTERHRAEKELQAATAELKRSNRELELFAYVASHDLQEPLRSVASYTQLVKRDYGAQLDERAQRFLSFASAGALRMQALINDLLAYSRVGSRTEEFRLVDCNQALTSAINNLDLAIRDSGADVRTGPLPIVLADEVQIVQLFQNLLANALKFRGTAPPQVSVGAELKDGVWQFVVADNGIGIKPKYNERIFGIFQRLHKREEYSGTGIGLAVCKRIVERHHGRIWVESEEGQGARFFFTVPAAETTAAVSAAAGNDIF